MLYKRYAGSFVNCKGQTWRVEIWQAANAPFTSVGSLTFDADTPLELEWEEREKYETTCGATLTINIVSPADRTFTDLFQISPGNVMAHVYLDDALFWVGGLDCETYEEPYQSEKDYTVTLTFTDFGHMQRLKYGEAGGIKSVRHYIDYCLEQVGLSAVPVEVLTSLEVNTDVFRWSGSYLTDVYVDAANFYDEDGEASTLDEVLDGVLQPLALRIVQRAGKIMVYDLNALRNDPPKVEQITWDATEQTLSVDKLAQAAVVKFSPYTEGTLLSDNSVTIEQDKLTEVDSMYNKVAGKVKVYEISKFFHSASDSAATGLAQKNADAHYFKMVKTGKGGEACEGLAWLALTDCHPRNNLTLNGEQSPLSGEKGYRYQEASGGVITRAFNDLSGTSNEVLMRFPRVYCPAAQKQISDAVLTSYIHLTMEMMIDPRLNPFADAEDYTNEKDNFNWCKVREAYCHVPFSLVLFDGNGKAILQYRASEAGSIATACWVPVEYDDTNYFTHAPSYLLYYANSKSDSIKEESGIQGWSKNRTHFFNSAYPISADQYPTEGEIIPLPYEAGYLELTIYTGCIIFDDRDGKGKEYPITNPQTCQLDKSLPDPNGLRDVCISTQTSKRGQRMNWAQRWWLYKFPKLEVVQGLITEAVEKTDAEYSAWINASAKDEIKIDTICGTSYGSNIGVTARGAYKAKSSLSVNPIFGIPQRCFLRRTNTSAPWLIEYDLLGLLFSQYGHRVPTLEGEAITPLSPLQLFTDRAMPSEDLFMMKSEVLSAYDGTSNIKFVRLEPEEWNKEIIK